MWTIYFVLAVIMNPLIKSPLVYRIIMGVALPVGLEILNYRGIAEQARLFLKSEVALRQ
jgi:hypothetical protein